MKGLAIYKMERVGAAVDRLDAAVARLESAFAEHPIVPDGQAGAEISALRKSLSETEARHIHLREAADTVAARLDGVIARVETLVKAG